MSGLDASLGVKRESTYAVAVPVDRFYEQVKNSLKGMYERIESEAVRKGTRTLRADRFAVNPKGAGGSITLEVLSKAFGFWFETALGGTATTVAGTAGDTGSFTHRIVPASLVGKSFTAQVVKPDAVDAVNVFTYPGCKVGGWTLSADVDGVLTLEVEVDAASEKIGTGSGAFAAQEVEYDDLDGSELFTFAGGHVAIAGSEVKVGSVSIKGDNALKTDRWSQGGTKREPVQDGMAEYTFELGMEFEGSSHLQRVASATAAGALAEVVTYWTSPTLIQGTTKYPTVKVILKNARFDGDLPEIDGAKMIELNLSGKALETDADKALAIEYTTANATP